MVNPARVLTLAEVSQVCEQYGRRSRSVVNRDVNHAVFRLACLGLRVTEIAGLNLGDLVLAGERPTLTVRKETTKGVQKMVRGVRTTVRRGRTVPLWWDEASLEFLRTWHAKRLAQFFSQLEAGQTHVRDLVTVLGRNSVTHDRPFEFSGDEPVICSQEVSRRGNFLGERLTAIEVARRWKTAIRCLGPERVSQLSIHCGRHTFISHALRSGRPQAEVREAVGHSSIAMLDAYAHCVDDCQRQGVYAASQLPTAVTIPEPLAAQLAKWCKANGTTPGEAVAFAVRSLVTPLAIG